MPVESQGVLLEWNGHIIGEVISQTGPGGSPSVIDVSHLTSAAVDKLISLPDEGQVTLEVNWLSADTAQMALRQDRIDRTKRTGRILLTDTSGTILTFEAYCTGFSSNSAVNQQAKGSITMEITDEVNYSPRLVVHTAYTAGVIVLDLEEDTFAGEAATENVNNWSWNYGGSGLVVSSINKESDTQVTITYSEAAKNAGTWTLKIQATATALTGSYPTGIFEFTVTLTV